MSEARVKVSFGDAVIEIEGSESFVDAQLQRFGASICTRIAPTGQVEAAAAPPPEEPAMPEEVDLTGIFRVTDRGVLQIVPDIPGDTRSEKMANAARLLAHGAERLQHKSAVPFRDVIAACKAQRCYDQKNLASALKKRGSAFVFSGRKRQQTIGLSESGRKEAEALIRALTPPASLVRPPTSPA